MLPSVKAVHSKRSLPANRVRAGLKQVEASARFEQLVLVVVLANCVTLALYDPADDGCRSQRCAALEVCEMLFIIFFLIECGIRIAALGAREFFRWGWNRLDFAIVIVGLVDFLPGVEGGPLSVLRLSLIHI